MYFAFNLDAPRLYDNRDVSLTARFSPFPGSILSVIRGKKFPLDVTDPQKNWLKLQSFISLVYSQLLSSTVPKFVVTVADLQRFLDSSNLDELEALCPQILLLFLKHKSGVVIHKEMGSVVDKLAGRTECLHRIMEGC